MNRHAGPPRASDALVAYARHFGGEPADEATMVSVDRLGFELRVRAAGSTACASAFPPRWTTARQSREVLVAMAQQARSPGTAR
jgi:putative heme iron utilization protein